MFATVSLAAWVFFGRVRTELATLQAAEVRAAREHERTSRRVEEQARTLERLRGDPVYLERTIRQRLNYVKPGEVVFRFRED